MLLRVAISHLAEDDGLAATFGVDGVDCHVDSSLDRRLEPGEGEAWLVRIGDVVEWLAAGEEVDVAVINLQNEFLRQPAVVSRHAFDLHACVRLVRQGAVAHRERLAWNDEGERRVGRRRKRVGDAT